MNQSVYLDNAATTEVDERVIEAMMPYLRGCYGNASSLHSFGTKAKEILDESRKKLASIIGAQADEIYFTSSGTEANNLALKGVAFANRKIGNHIIVSSIEHDCVLNSCKWLEEQGFYVTYLPVDQTGLVDIEFLNRCINAKTLLVSVMHANNEIGTIQSITEIGEICRTRNVHFHTDACQSFGKLPIHVDKLHINLMTLNSHKIYGPKGVAAMYIRKGTKIAPLLHGGGQEGGIRSSTENVAGIVGFVKAAELCMEEINSEPAREFALRESLVGFLLERFSGIYINGHIEKRLPGHLSFGIHGMEGETIRLLLLLDEMGIAVSAGSACSSNDKTNHASHVLQAIGLNPFEARGSIRISMGRFTTGNDVEIFKHALELTVSKLNTIYSN
jgi:cysteine desulfurase